MTEISGDTSVINDFSQNIYTQQGGTHSNPAMSIATRGQLGLFTNIFSSCHLNNVSAKL